MDQSQHAIAVLTGILRARAVKSEIGTINQVPLHHWVVMVDSLTNEEYIHLMQAVLNDDRSPYSSSFCGHCGGEIASAVGRP